MYVALYFYDWSEPEPQSIDNVFTNGAFRAHTHLRAPFDPQNEKCQVILMMRHFKTRFYSIVFMNVVHCTLFALNKHISHDWSQLIPHKVLGNRPKTKSV